MKSFLDIDESGLRGLTDDEGYVMLNTAAFDSGLADPPQSLIQELSEILDNAFLVKVMRGRLTKSDVKMNLWLEYLLTVNMTSPGTAVMWAYTILCIARKLNKKNISINDLLRFFGMGFPKDDAMHEIWDSQKDRNSPNGNLLDNADIWSWEKLSTERAMDLS